MKEEMAPRQRVHEKGIKSKCQLLKREVEKDERYNKEMKKDAEKKRIVNL